MNLVALLRTSSTRGQRSRTDTNTRHLDAHCMQSKHAHPSSCRSGQPLRSCSRAAQCRACTLPVRSTSARPRLEGKPCPLTVRVKPHLESYEYGCSARLAFSIDEPDEDPSRRSRLVCPRAFGFHSASGAPVQCLSLCVLRRTWAGAETRVEAKLSFDDSETSTASYNPVVAAQRLSTAPQPCHLVPQRPLLHGTLSWRKQMQSHEIAALTTNFLYPCLECE